MTGGKGNGEIGRDKREAGALMSGLNIELFMLLGSYGHTKKAAKERVPHINISHSSP
jgi:hypothetical protein